MTGQAVLSWTTSRTSEAYLATTERGTIDRSASPADEGLAASAS
jgi:hypothetical protein